MCSYKERFEPISCKVTLQNKDLWRQFHELETEMIITKSGRRMFPSLRVQISGLDPNAHYCVFLEMASASNCRYKYAASGGWAPAGAEEAHSPHRLYLHPESPSTGEQWMSQPVSFGRVKLTNTPTPPLGHLVLSSMHKYQPRIIVAKTANPRFVMCVPSVTVAFEETSFIAVTAYQNDKITKLKIDNNPFAKGFRVNGQSKCKRKRVGGEESEVEMQNKNKSPPPQQTPSPVKIEEDRNSENEASCPTFSSFPAPQLLMPYRYPVISMYDMGANPYHTSPYGYYGYQQLQYYYSPFQNQPYQKVPSIELPKPKKLTDFSIKAITGIS